MVDCGKFENCPSAVFDAMSGKYPNEYIRKVCQSDVVIIFQRNWYNTFKIMIAYDSEMW